jgi:hypothetical protein
MASHEQTRRELPATLPGEQIGIGYIRQNGGPQPIVSEYSLQEFGRNYYAICEPRKRHHAPMPSAQKIRRIAASVIQYDSLL